MYFSQNSIVLVLLVFLTSTIFYQTVNIKTNDVENSIEIKKIALYTNNIETAANRNLDKIVNDVFVNISYSIMNGDIPFYNNASNAKESIENNISYKLNNSLSKLNNRNITLSVGNISITHTNNPLVVNIKGNVNLYYTKEVNNVSILSHKNIEVNKNIKLSKIPDPYVYKNHFYYTWHNEREINIDNFPNDNNNNNHTFCIILNNSNFNYSHMYNSSSPREIRIIGWNSTSNKWNVLLPYWVYMWKNGNSNMSIIWIRCNKNQIYNYNNGQGYIKLLYNSTTKVDRQNPENTFILFDDFNNNRINRDIWNVSGAYYIEDGKLIVQGLGSSVWTNKTYGPGYELMFKGNFTPVHAQAVGFFENKSDTDGVGWDCYEWDSRWLYMRINNMTNVFSGDYVTNGENYLNKFYIYDIDRMDKEVNFSIMDGNLSVEYNKSFSSSLLPPPLNLIIDKNNRPISINTFTNSNATVSIDWIFLRNISDENIKTTIGNENTNPTYKEEKPKTFTGTIYYGDPTQYTLDNSTDGGNYSIIGILTNATDSWGTIGYKPKIETE
ncbi:DUF2341 domain-containing protein [Methanothermococcus okinawensis]|uniref:DUF2341 domain-containing protein n=1 Tax=Methanothermococcus okinawensis (strain DSM 14208 / JCM 11175 / IH1) TaxID=647113 RepID=F8AJW3_METOI|nr:DUF2341 domain-containing protein [Methanothermococcus okinawensis]AEH07319.1 Protein of unknown function DUF2341 [Methanothermococcus okinawensis IH1]